MNSLSSGSQEPTAPSTDITPDKPTSNIQKQGKGVLRTLTSLHQRNFRLFWFGQLISLIGTWMQSIGQAWLVLELTHSAWQLGLVGALQSLPVLLFSLVGGVFADRWPKRHILLVTQLAATLQALLLWLLIITGTVQLWHLYILAILLGFTYSLDLPTRRAFIVELVGREDLPNAVALSASLTTFARIVGPGLGGILIAVSGVGMLFLFNALSFLPLIVGLALIRSHELHTQGVRRMNDSEQEQPHPWQSLREGIDYIWHTPTILLLLIVVGLVLLFGSNFNVVLPLLATGVLHVGSSGFGFLSAAIGIGALLATLWLAWRNRQPTIRGLLLAMLIFGVLEAAFAFSQLYLLSLALIACVGFMETAFAAQSMTALQTIAPNHLSGRIMSVSVLFFDGTLPLGYVLMGWLAALYGPSLALLIGALLSLLVVGAGWIWHKVAEKD